MKNLTVPLAVAAVTLGLCFPSRAEWRSGYIRDDWASFCMTDCTVYGLESEVEDHTSFITWPEMGIWGLQPYADQRVLVYGYEDACLFCTSFYIMALELLPDVVALAPIVDLTLAPQGPGISLFWTAPTTDVNGYQEVDIEGYRVHGSRDPWFEPTEANLLGTTTDTHWTLPWPGVNDPCWFRVVAVGQTRIDLP